MSTLAEYNAYRASQGLAPANVRTSGIYPDVPSAYKTTGTATTTPSVNQGTTSSTSSSNTSSIYPQYTPPTINTSNFLAPILSGQINPDNATAYLESQLKNAYIQSTPGSVLGLNAYQTPEGKAQLERLIGSLSGQSVTFNGQNYQFGTGGSAIKTSTTNRMSTTTPTGTSVQTTALNNYRYVDKNGNVQTIQASSPEQAMQKAPNISPSSGVQLISGSSTSAPTTSSVQSGINSYTVQSGDTLSAIASRMGVPISQLTGYQSGNPNLIYPGEVITVKGNSTTPTGTSNSVTSSSLLPSTSSYNLSSTSYNTNSDAIIGGVDATSKSIQDYINLLTPNSSANKTNYDYLSSKIQELLPEVGGRGQAQLTAEEQAGVNNLKKSLTDINNQITQKMAEYEVVSSKYDSLNTELEGKPITMNSIIGSQAQVNKMALAEKNSFASNIGLLQAQAQSLQGNLELAQESANRAVDLKYSDVTDYINILYKQLDLVKDDLTKEEGIRADAIKMYLQDQKDQLAVSVANQKDMNSTLLNLMQSYPDAGISLSDSIESANQKITNNSSIYRKAIRIPDSETSNEELVIEQETTPETSTGGIWDWVKGAYNYVTGNKTTTPMTTGSSGTTSSGLNYTIK